MSQQKPQWFYEYGYDRWFEDQPYWSPNNSDQWAYQISIRLDLRESLEGMPKETWEFPFLNSIELTREHRLRAFVPEETQMSELTFESFERLTEELEKSEYYRAHKQRFLDRESKFEDYSRKASPSGELRQDLFPLIHELVELRITHGDHGKICWRRR
jgi:hypothetical protein